jgi:hypothetical protein
MSIQFCKSTLATIIGLVMIIVEIIAIAIAIRVRMLSESVLLVVF